MTAPLPRRAEREIGVDDGEPGYRGETGGDEVASQRADRGGAVALAGCSTAVNVQTIAAPDVRLGHLHTFRIMQPSPRTDAASTSSNPILVNPINNQALRADIETALRRHGFVESDSAPDFLVAYYATANEALDLNAWNYGYAWRPRWGRWGYGPLVTEFTQGSVVIDLVDPATKELLWRGNGVAQVSDQPAEFRKDLRQTVNEILEKLPNPPA